MDETGEESPRNLRKAQAEKMSRRRRTPPSPLDYVRGNTAGRPGVALPVSKKQSGQGS